MSQCRPCRSIPHTKAGTNLRGAALSDSVADTLSTLPVVQARLVTGHSLGSLLHDLCALGEDHLDVAGVGHVRVDLKTHVSCHTRA